MKALREVVAELLKFVFEEGFGFLSQPELTAKENVIDRAQLEVVDTPSYVKDQSSAQRLTVTGENLYVISEKTSLWNAPAETFDGVLRKLPYGTLLLHLRTDGRWCEVSTEDTVGWVRESDVTADTIYPKFISGQSYDFNHSETKKLRVLIEDEFSGGLIHLPLQDVEYVTYQLQRRGQNISWDQKRPRTPGAWQRRLRGKSGVYIGVVPKTTAIMETVGEDDTGQVAFVDAVFPDESIMVTGVTGHKNGDYYERNLLKEEWRELRPIFISVN